MPTIRYILIALVLMTASLSAAVDTVKAPTLWDAYLSGANQDINYPTDTSADMWYNSATTEYYQLVVGVAGLDALIGSNTRDSVVFRVGKTSNGTANGEVYLKGIWKYNFTETDPTYNDWNEPDLNWGAVGAMTAAAIASGTFNATDSGGDDCTTENLDTISSWNTGGIVYTTGYCDSTFFPITTLDTVWWVIRTSDTAAVDVATSEHATVPMEIIIYSTAATSGATTEVKKLRKCRIGKAKL